MTLEGRLRLVNGLDRAVWAQVEAAPLPQLLRLPPRSAAPTVLCADATVEVSDTDVKALHGADRQPNPYRPACSLGGYKVSEHGFCPNGCQATNACQSEGCL